MAEQGRKLFTSPTNTRVFIYFLSLCGLVISIQSHVHVHEFEKREAHFSNLNNDQEFLDRAKRDASTGDDATCDAQQSKYLSQYLGNGTKKLEDLHVFEKDGNSALALTWAGNDGVLIVVTTSQYQNIFSRRMWGHSTVYRSSDNGKTFTNISHKIGNAFIRKSAGLQRNVHTPEKVYLISPGDHGYIVYVTEDGGLTFGKYSLPFELDGTFKYHEHRDDYMLGRSLGVTKDLYISTDNAKTWAKIKDNIAEFTWATPESQKEWGPCLYATQIDKNSHNKLLKGFNIFTMKPLKILVKSCDLGKTWSVLLKSVHSFGIKGKFMFASVVGQKKNERIMKVSTDGGITWALTVLPTIIHGQFYSVLDMSEGVVFIHVDNPGDSGHGVLYMSAGRGIIFSESLKFHLYPNFADITDFYPVRSMRGVYITSQMLPDKSIQTMISYNRGAAWSKLTKPPGSSCKKTAKTCNLHLHNTYSISRHILAEPPMSVDSAVGLILAHGHVATSLQTTEPDVYVSDDGGYSWKFALKGAHTYQIADSGGLLVAVDKNREHKAQHVKFSVDEGRCWHTYQFSDEPIFLTGLLTEPGSKSATIGIWGFGVKDKKWRSFVIDFSKIVKRKCSSNDYEKWIASNTYRSSEAGDQAGCLLGLKEEFKRLKKDSWCMNGYAYKATRVLHKCTCTREDYECDYSFMRPVGKDDCVKQPGFKVQQWFDICLRGHEEKIVTEGYRKLPGDNCTGDIHLGDKIIDLSTKCVKKDGVIPDLKVQPREKMGTKASSIGKTILFVVLGLSGSILLIFLAGIFVYKFYSARKHTMYYRYSLLHHNDERDYDGEFENALTNMTNVFEDTEDEKKSERKAKKPNGKANTSYHDDSDVEMLE